MYLDVKLEIVRKGLRQWQIAQELGVPESKLSKFLNGHGVLRPEEVQKLTAILGIGKDSRGEREQE